MRYVVDLSQVNSGDIELVGGKNASTGEMIQNLSKAGIKAPGGFATTTEAYQQFLAQSDLNAKIYRLLANLKVNNVQQLKKVGQQIRQLIIKTPFFPEFEAAITTAYKNMKNKEVAVRSSATAEDLANASFAGAQETFLNIKGIDNILHAIKLVFASLFTDRVIVYRHNHHFDHDKVSMSVGIQPMIRSDLAASGVLFTLDTESGFDKVILITGSYGLGEAIVQGRVNPDEFIVYKPTLEAGKDAILQRKLGSKLHKTIYTKSKDPHKSIKTVAVAKSEQQQFCLTDKEVATLAKQALIIEKHYGKPMDIEWAKDGPKGELYILQARAETVQSQTEREQVIERYTLDKKSKVLTAGQSIGQKIGAGNARIILDMKQMSLMQAGEVLVTDMTDPDWEPIMKRASAIVTNRGGRTCHAAIIARELGIPAVVGCADATKVIKNKMPVTVSCIEGQTGYIYSGILPYKVNKIAIDNMPALPLKLYVNVGNPDMAFVTQFLPNSGVGLARLEFIISNMIGIHPNACLNFKKLAKPLQQKILARTSAYKNPTDFYVQKLTEGIATIAAAFYPKEVVFRFSDFKTNEYANLVGGELYEPAEENPMIGFRGASRYNHASFRQCFALECQAFKNVREKMGLTNAVVMIPFVRTVNELENVITLMEQHGLKRGDHGLKIYMMCEVPSNVILADEFLKHVDGFSIGSNDLTQLTLGLDRDSATVAHLFDERNGAVKALLHQVIQACNKAGKYIGICGQAPSDHPELAKWLMHEGIQTISLNPDTVVETWLALAGDQQEFIAPLLKEAAV